MTSGKPLFCSFLKRRCLLQRQSFETEGGFNYFTVSLKNNFVYSISYRSDDLIIAIFDRQNISLWITFNGFCIPQKLLISNKPIRLERILHNNKNPTEYINLPIYMGRKFTDEDLCTHREEIERRSSSLILPELFRISISDQPFSGLCSNTFPDKIALGGDKSNRRATSRFM